MIQVATCGMMPGVAIAPLFKWRKNKQARYHPYDRIYFPIRKKSSMTTIVENNKYSNQ